MNSINMGVASGGAVRACIEAKDVAKFLELYGSFGFKPSGEEMGQIALIIALSKDTKLEQSFRRAFPYFTVSEEGCIIREICKHCKRQENIDYEQLLAFALGYATNRVGANEAIEELLAAAIDKRVNCFSKIKEHLGRKFYAGEIDQIVSIGGVKGDPEILIEILPDANCAIRNLVVEYFADAGMPRMMKKALDAIGREATIDEIDRLATGIRDIN